MACELRHSRERLKQWVQEHGTKRHTKSAAERVQGSAAQLELQVAKRCQELQRLEAEAARVQEALAVAKTKVQEADAQQEAAQLSLAKELQASLRAEKELLEQLEEIDESIRADAALCDKASAAAEVSSFQLRSVRCQLKPLEAQLAREEAVLVAMSQELDAGRQRAAQLASEAAQARQRKEHFGAVREPLVAYFAARAYQDWESQRADALHRRLLLRRCLRGLVQWRQAAPKLRAEVDALRERRQQVQLRFYWSDWAALRDRWRRVLRMLAWTFQRWSTFAATRPRRRWLLMRCWRVWQSARTPLRATPVLEAAQIDSFASRWSRHSLLRAFRGWRRTSWQALRSRNWLTQRWRHKGAMAAKQALQHLRAVVQHRSPRERYFCWLWRRMVKCLGGGHPFPAWRCWAKRRQAAQKRAEVRLAQSLQSLLALESCRTAWLQWYGLLRLRMDARIKAAEALRAPQGVTCQRSKRRCLAILMTEVRLAKAARCVSGLVRVSHVQHLIHSWHDLWCCRKGQRSLISRIQRSCLATTLVAWLRTTQRRHRAGPAAEKLTALARQGRARRVLRDWLLATARQVVAQRPASPAKEVHKLKHELAMVQQRVSRLKDGHGQLQQEAVACRNQLNAAEKAAEMARTEEQKASLEYQAYMETMEKRHVDVEGSLCEALRRNCRLARQLISAQEASAVGEKRLEASEESAAVLRSQMEAAEGQYVAAMAILCSETLRLREHREQLAKGPLTTSMPSQPSDWEQEV